MKTMFLQKYIIMINKFCYKCKNEFFTIKRKKKKKQNYTKIELFFHYANNIFNKLYMTRIRDQKFDNSHKYK